jgi:protein-L-isoaspartate(D-aspartate) O-methyltransferase
LHPGSIPGEASKSVAVSRFKTTAGAFPVMIDFAAVRRSMVDTQLRTYDVTSKRVLDAVESVAREHFIPSELAGLAYTDQTFTVSAGPGQTRAMLAPMVLARMIQATDLQRGESILNVAGGSGYGAAVMAAMGGRVTLLEESDDLAGLARLSLAKANVDTVNVVAGNLASGLNEESPFDVIFVEGSVETEPQALFLQLAERGRLVTVMGSGRAGRVVVFQNNGGNIGRHTVFDASAYPLSAFLSKPEFQL